MRPTSRRQLVDKNEIILTHGKHVLTCARIRTPRVSIFCVALNDFQLYPCIPAEIRSQIQEKCQNHSPKNLSCLFSSASACILALHLHESIFQIISHFALACTCITKQIPATKSTTRNDILIHTTNHEAFNTCNRSCPL